MNSKTPTFSAILSLVLFVTVVGANSLSLGPIAPNIAVALESTTVQVLYGTSAYSLGTAFSALLLARFIDYFGTLRSLRFGMCVFILAMLGIAVSDSLLIMVITQGIAGLAAGVILPAVYAQATEIAPKGQENTIMGRVLVGWMLSMVFGVSLAAWLADILGWRSVFYGIASITTLALIINTISLGIKLPKAPKGESISSPLRALKISGVMPLLLVCLCYMMAFYGAYGYVSDHVRYVLDRPIRFTGLIAMSYGIGFGLAAWGDKLIDRYTARVVMPWAFVSIGLVYGLLGYGSGYFEVILALAFFWGVFNHFGLSVILTELASIEPKQKGTIMGLYSAITYVGASVGTYIYGLIYSSYDYAALNFVSMGLLLGSAVFVWRGSVSRQIS